MPSIPSLTTLNPARFDSPAVLKRLTSASRKLAELKGVAGSIPNQGILINALGLQEAKDSSEIENIVTTHDELFKGDVLPEAFAHPAAKEVLRYRLALQLGFLREQETGLITVNHLIEIQGELERNNAGFRKLPGTALKSGSGATVYTPPQDPVEIVALMSDLERFINDADLFAVDPLIKMALIHHQFESIHPFYDGNGRTGRILNLLYLVAQGLLNLPVLYLSRHIIDHKPAYYEGLRRVTEEGAWGDWVLYMLDAVEQTSLRTRQQITDILALMEAVRERVQREAPGVYSKDLIEHIFRQPYCKIQFLERAGIGTRQTCAKYLRELERLGVLHGQKIGREVYFINQALFGLLTR